MTELVHMLDATKDVQTFFVFFIPGFISLLISGMIGPIPESDFAKRIVAAVGYSALNFAAMSAVLGILDWLGLSSSDGTIRALFLYVLPFVYPFVLYRMREKQLFGFSTPFPSTWDQFFARRNRTFFVRAHLKGDDDAYVHGLYHMQSLSSQAPAEQMLFLERVYSVDKSGTWEEHRATAGLLLPMSECRTIEFFYSEATDKHA